MAGTILPDSYRRHRPMPRQLQSDVGTWLLAVPAASGRVYEQDGHGRRRNKKGHGVGGCAPLLRTRA